jgi:histidine triad (HIT) family protein
MECLGCQLADSKLPVHIVFQDEFVCCILDHSPFNEGHVLILPKKHIRFFDELDEMTANSLIFAAAALTKAIRKVFRPDGITVCQNGGKFDELTHFHMHIVPRYEGQSFAEFYIEGEDGIIEDENKLAETAKRIISAISDIKN